MLKKELRQNLKGFIIWVMVIIFFFTFVFLIYPSMMKDAEKVKELIATMPKEMLSMFNMDIIGVETVFGWIATEGYMMLSLIGSCFFAVMGSSIVLKEESEGTIEFLYAKPITRNKILHNKILAGIIYIGLFNLSIALTTLIGLTLSNDFNFIKWFLLSLSPVMLNLFFFIASILISTYLHKTSKSIGMCLGAVFGFYFISILSGMSKNIEFLKYFTPFEYVNERNIILHSSLDIVNLLILIGVVILLTIKVYRNYNRKELV